MHLSRLSFSKFFISMKYPTAHAVKMNTDNCNQQAYCKTVGKLVINSSLGWHMVKS